MIKFLFLFMLLTLPYSAKATSHFPDLVKEVTESVVGIGIYTPTANPKHTLLASGFVIGNGSYIVTNHHVVADKIDTELLQQYVIFIGKGNHAKIRVATLVISDVNYDLAVLKITGKPLKPLTLAKKTFRREGEDVAFTGFPIGSVLGLYPVTHKGMISAITPIIIPVNNSKQLNIKMLKRLRDPYFVYQLDATAYPGNSGSVMYDTEKGEVIGIINKVFVQGTKETVISHPSGITYAIPVKYLHQLLNTHQINTH